MIAAHQTRGLHWYQMQILQAGRHQVFSLELDPETVRQIVGESGMACIVEDSPRNLDLEISAPEREGPLLVFDASDAGNTGWFSRCLFYIEGPTGAVMQTPFTVSNRRDAHGRLDTKALGLQIHKEMPSHFRMPGRQSVNEKMVYGVLLNFLAALQQTGVGICGRGAVEPLAGRAPARK